MKLSAIVTRYLLFLITIALPPLILTLTNNAAWLIPRFWVLYGFVAAATLMVIILVVFITQKNHEMGAQAFLAGTTMKILACLFFVVFFLKKVPVNRVVFALDFCYVYFLNTAFEVYGLLRNLRNQNLR